MLCTGASTGSELSLQSLRERRGNPAAAACESLERLDPTLHLERGLSHGLRPFPIQHHTDQR
jgi:hypothetical protein